jgi:aryl-alcohol dehydrogenase-like predicted oxidoreductase
VSTGAKEAIMKYRVLGKTGFNVSEVSLGTWQLGGKWGQPYDDKNAEATLRKAVDEGINFFDSADVYGDRRSERSIGTFIKSCDKRIYVATKCGRRLKPHVSEGYNEANIRKFVEESLSNMGLAALDLIQLHCPPTEVYYRPEVFETLDALKKEGKLLNYGVSVEKVEEALKAIEYPGVASVQIIFNMFRQRPAELLFPQAKKKNVGIIVRVPLASGLLSGTFTRNSTFGREDHRFFNREGKAFDRGETFSGVDYEKGLTAVEELKKLFPDDANLAQIALRWVLMFEEVSCVIPGASRSSQVEMNARASGLPPLTDGQMKGVREVYGKRIKPLVHHLW